MTRIGSLCSGYGGLELGLLTTMPGTVLWHCENDKHASKILDERWPGVPNLHDIKAVDWHAVEPVDWLCAGYPCQPFSDAGKRLGEDDERHLWPYVAAAIRVLRPRRVLLENVAGHFARGFGSVLGDLAALGYDATWACVRAADAGAPHGRARVFVVAADTRSGSFTRPGAARDGLPVIAERGFESVTDTRGSGWRQDDPRGRGVVGQGGVQAGWNEGAGPSGSNRDVASADPCESGRASLASGNGAEPAMRLPDPDGSRVEWGAYKPAIRRWERVTGRTAPRPTDPGRNGRERLSPVFVEWMQGLDEGWVTDVDIPRNAQLAALGNGVVPQQAALAVRTLMPLTEVAA